MSEEESGRKIEMKRPNESFERREVEAKTNLYSTSIVTVLICLLVVYILSDIYRK
jgi:hypothetical protein